MNLTKKDLVFTGFWMFEESSKIVAKRLKIATIFATLFLLPEAETSYNRPKKLG